MAQTRISEADEGKRVVDEEGNEIGLISGFRSGKAYVDPDPGITDSILAKLGWENIDEDDYTLAQSDVETTTGEEVRLKR
jgi:hypothetical protein